MSRAMVYDYGTEGPVAVGVSVAGVKGAQKKRRERLEREVRSTDGDDPDLVTHKVNYALSYNVLVKQGEDGRFYWSRVHDRQVRSIGGQGFDTQREADEDEAFDAQMVRTGVGSIHVWDED